MNKNTAAVILGRLGGKAKSERKLASSRLNGRLGGRPRFDLVPIADRIRRVLRSADWRIELFEFVDDFRKHPNPELIAQKPSQKDARLYSLTSSIILYLCHERKVNPPAWVIQESWLPTPYFVGDFQSLKATALLECPIEFRRNNVWVLSNFMERV